MSAKYKTTVIKKVSVVVITLILVMNLSSCSITKNKNYIKVGGVAVDSNAGAMIIVKKEDDRAYFLDGIYFWPNDVIGKKMVVTGLLKKVDMDSLYKDQPYMKRVLGIKYTILRPKWKIITDE